MSRNFTLEDPEALGDLRVFLGRAQRVDDGSVRLVASSGVLAVYVSVLHPAGLLDESPAVLGLRTFALTAHEVFDAVVPVRSLLARVEKSLEAAAARPADRVTVSLPMEVNTVTWSAISPPRSGWRVLPRTKGRILDAAAKSGIEQVAAALPAGTGEQIVQRVRSQIWGRGIDGVENIPAGAAFAALSLGFLGDDDDVAIFESGSWTRLTTARGHVLIKRRAWALSR